MEAIKALVQLGAQPSAQTAEGETSLQVSIRCGLHQALRQLERTSRTRKAAATKDRAQQAATEKWERC